MRLDPQDAFVDGAFGHAIGLVHKFVVATLQVQMVSIYVVVCGAGEHASYVENFLSSTGTFS